MKRKKWTEEEEETLISKYADLLNSGTLPKLKTREKKFQPIADHVNSVHHLQDPISFPFRWSWRDVSIKVQNMRHQYLGVKQKIRVSDEEFNWTDGQDHWPNFFKYKEVFGDVELDVTNSNRRSLIDDDNNGSSDVLGLGLGIDCKDFDGSDGDDDDDVMGHSDDGEENLGSIKRKRLKKEGLGFLGSQILELRDLVGRREERERGRRFSEEEEVEAREARVREREDQMEERWREREERMEAREFGWEERQRVIARREFERRLRVEREFNEDRRRWLMKMEEKREEEEMAFRERMVALQIEHEKQMMQMHAESCQNQMQVLGVLVRVVCQFFGSGTDGLGGGLGSIPPQVLQNLQHPGNLVGDNGKPDGNSDSHFM
ncbi:hypothetical protein BVC80_9095g87 [Macleaya cordata]|uniref:Uncharacterized protein n=1 Tax=Macleaya cordata TaxID=56857 RepID=A0A200PXG1_MACCD|nr:hypothetical protein BVC80_9095g87 [Macleaya cordata]